MACIKYSVFQTLNRKMNLFNYFSLYYIIDLNNCNRRTFLSSGSEIRSERKVAGLEFHIMNRCHFMIKLVIFQKSSASYDDK